MSATSEDSAHTEAISQFVAFTGADEERAKSLLEACDWNLELAVNMHVDIDDGRRVSATAVPSGSSSNPPLVTVPDSDVSFDVDDESSRTNASTGSSSVLGNRQTARRSRTNDASGSGSSSSAYQSVDNVRPPMRPFRDQIVQAPIGFSPHDFSHSGAGLGSSSSNTIQSRRYNTRTGSGTDSYEAFRDFKAEAEWQEAALADGELTAENDSTTANNRGAKTLHELFRPPLDLMYRGSLSGARETGTTKNKWLLVNIQNGLEFACQILNRDVWSNPTVKDIVREHFIFWQVNHDSFDGARYVQFYNVSSYPHLSIIDPRTGEQMRSWPTNVDHSSFCDSVIEFLTENPTPENYAEKPPQSSSKAAFPVAKQPAKIEPRKWARRTPSHTDGSPPSGGMRLHFNRKSNPFPGKDSKAIKSSSSNNKQTINLDNDDVEDIDDDDTEEEDFVEEVKIQDRKNKHENNQQNDNEHPGQEVEEKVVVKEDYKKYLGIDEDKMSELAVRFPNGTRKQYKLPSDSLMKALFLLLSSEGYDMENYNYVTTFPRRLLHELPPTDTLCDAKLMRENIIVERKLES